MHRSEGATALLGLDGFVVGAQLEVDGEWWLAVETTADVTGCEGAAPERWPTGNERSECGTCPMADRAVVLVWRKRIWRCPRGRLRGEHLVRGHRRHRPQVGAHRTGPS